MTVYQIAFFELSYKEKLGGGVYNSIEIISDTRIDARSLALSL